MIHVHTKHVQTKAERTNTTTCVTCDVRDGERNSNTNTNTFTCSKRNATKPTKPHRIWRSRRHVLLAPQYLLQRTYYRMSTRAPRPPRPRVPRSLHGGNSSTPRANHRKRREKGRVDRSIVRGVAPKTRRRHCPLTNAVAAERKRYRGGGRGQWRGGRGKFLDRTCPGTSWIIRSTLTSSVLVSHFATTCTFPWFSKVRPMSSIPESSERILQITKVSSDRVTKS